MGPSSKSTAVAAAGLLALASTATAGFNANSETNIAVYWGQNSYGQKGSQTRLIDYCQNDEIDIIPLAFMNGIKTPIVNFANAGDNCTAISGTQLLDCPQLEEDIPACQALGKTIMLSLGGATYTEGGFGSSAEAEAAAQTVWDLFGSDTTQADRPFGSAVVDGFDFDFESVTANLVPFALTLRARMDADADASKPYYLSAAPQCPYPDAADGAMLDGAVAFDFVMVQFYNNYCGASAYVPGAGAADQFNFNFATWDAWARDTSANPAVKVLLGVPANAGAGAGYLPAATLDPVIQFAKQYPSFGGVMMWDMSQLYANPGFLDAVDASLTSGGGGGGGSPPPTTTTTPGSPGTTMTTSTRTSTPTSTLVPQWGQCGGEGYTGSTECAPPYTCVESSQFWSACK
ncbi:chitinase [Xylariomycetidae sp. FL0641]|nr:chitinase [Xylariomycetidae sp. FL0641]